MQQTGQVSTLQRLVRACHPEPSVAVTGITTALAVRTGAPAVAVAAAFLSGQLSVGWSNDWIDAARDRAVARADKPVVQGLPVAVVRRAALLALTACVPLSLLLGPRAGAAHLVAVASAWLYNARWKATAWSVLPYVVSFGLVPSVVTLAAPGHHAAPWWASAAGALLGAGAHGANVLPDLEQDLATGVRGLPHRLGARVTTLLSGLCLVAATLLLALGPGASSLGLVAVGLSVAGFTTGVLLGRRTGSRAAFLSVILVAGVDVGLLLLRGDVLR